MGLLVHPVNKIKKDSESLLIAGKLRKFSQLTLQETATHKTMIDLENTTGGSLTCQTLIDLVQDELTKKVTKTTNVIKHKKCNNK